MEVKISGHHILSTNKRNRVRPIQLLLAQVRSPNASLVMVTHDPELAGRADRVMHLKDGVLVSA